MMQLCNIASLPLFFFNLSLKTRSFIQHPVTSTYSNIALSWNCNGCVSSELWAP
uniref:Uncharacterized protein n=1 Tax=Arundo donax TaxID=35708 RepID=A0A0A9F7G4_ARUDO